MKEAMKHSRKLQPKSTRVRLREARCGGHEAMRTCADSVAPLSCELQLSSNEIGRKILLARTIFARRTRVRSNARHLRAPSATVIVRGPEIE